MLTFLEISANFQMDQRWRLALCQCTSQSSKLVNSNTNAYHIPGHSLFQLLLSIKTNLLEYLTSNKALVIIPNDAPNSHVLAFLEFLVNALQQQAIVRERTLSMWEVGLEGFTNFSKKKKVRSPVNHRPKYFMTQ